MTGGGLKERELDGFEARLLPMLLEAVEEQRSRAMPRTSRSRRTLRRAGVVTLAAATLVIGSAVLVGGRSTIEVRGSDAVADPQAVVAELREAGIEARILVVPVDRPMAGTWWHLYFAPRVELDKVVWAKLKAQVGIGILPGLPEEILDSGRGVYHHEVLELPRNLPGPVTLVVGRERRPGEVEAPYDNELAPNGAFWCSRLDEKSPHRAGRTLEGLGYDVVWVLDRAGTFEGDVQYVEEPPDRSAITWISFLRPEVVEVRMVPAALASSERAAWQDHTPAWAPDCENKV
jgi:hypothetical protein